jgi:hypothetical protein
MFARKGVVEPIREAGAGGEARIMVQIRTLFPGLGGAIVTAEGVAAALRIEHNPTPLAGHEMFIRHLIAKKLDDHFYRSRVYVFAHVPRVLGSVSRGDGDVREAYLYEWAFGRDGFSWLRPGSYDPIVLKDWHEFVDAFGDAGLDLSYDTTDADDARVSQNLVHQYADHLPSGDLCSLWKRIDFGYRSILMNLERLAAFVHDQRKPLVDTLRFERYELVRLAVAYLRHRRGGERMSEYDLGRLVELICDFRRASLSHYAFAFGSTNGDVKLTGEYDSLLQ